MDHDAPAIGSLWEHEDGERRFVVTLCPYDLWTDGVEVVRITKKLKRSKIILMKRPRWHAWAAKARRLA